MDALDLLKSDHQRVKSLFDQFRAESGRQQKAVLFESIRKDLESHSNVEETVFYPAFKNYGDFTAILDSSLKDHGQIDELLVKLRSMPKDSPDFNEQMQTLMSLTERHILNEEEHFFPMVRKIMKRPERERLGRHMQAAKQESAAA